MLTTREIASSLTHDDADAFDTAAWLSQRLAEDTAPALCWTLPHVEAVEHAAAYGIHADGAGTYRRTPTGRRIAAERVNALEAGGFLTETEGIVTATADGVEAARRLRAVPDALMTPEAFRAHSHRVNRARAHGKRAELLPCLPGGEEDKRRQAADREGFAAYMRQAAVNRAVFAARQAAWEAADEAERAAKAAQREADLQQWAHERRYGCGSCPASWELDARCGMCRAASQPAPHVPEVEADEDSWGEPYAEPATQVQTRRPAVRAEITRHHQTGSQSQARITLPASRAHRARDHRAVVLEVARILGVQTTTPRRLLADGTHTGAEQWRHVDITGPTRAVDRMLTVLAPVMTKLERLATRAARRYGTWRRSLMTVLSGVLDDYTPAEAKALGRRYRSEVLSHLTASLAQGPRPVRDDARRPLWERADAVAAELWIQDPIDLWAPIAEQAAPEPTAVEPVAVEPGTRSAPHGPTSVQARRALRSRTATRRQPATTRPATTRPATTRPATTRPATMRTRDAARPTPYGRAMSAATRTRRPV
ncbi:hypothetical protein ADK91_03035 [Streptomyces sp. XY511]|uniref:hypothetical protein n=1 Tax=Streptomyces sp. XY511 TaxID=1519480 RepID=UPI0006AE6A20|nr:hypothetical protein [Streptomyces sp. XY511]KOV17165.1 hypothetical protein ADK91_03035 [Streptomyces sp. XY511]